MVPEGHPEHATYLTVADISADQHHGEFAFLSACKTAIGGMSLPDEDLTSSGVFEPVRAALALHTTIRRLRDRGARVSAWTPFTHTGA